MALLMSSSVSAPRWRTPASVPWSFSESESNMLPHRSTVPSAVELDLLVIGSGPGGQRAAIQAAKLGKRVAVAERRDRLGGVSIHTGHDPVEDPAPGRAGAARHAPAGRAGPDARRGDRAARRSQQLLDRAARRGGGGDRDHARAVPAQPRRAAAGRRDASRTPTRSQIDGSDEPIRARADRDRGRHAARRGRASVEFDDRTIIDSDGLLKLEHRVPRTMTVVGAGVIGVEYASMFGALGTKVTVVDKRDRVLHVPRRRDRRGVPVPAAARAT